MVAPNRKILLGVISICLSLVYYRRHKRWFRGGYQTLASVLIFYFKRIGGKSRLKFGTKERVLCQGGETCILWWGKGIDVQNLQGRHVWLILPGGMTHGDAFYTEEAVTSGVFRDQAWCVFHNPGIVNKVKSRAPPGLTETCFLEDCLLNLKSRGCRVSVMGFSAGSMLAIKIAAVNDSLISASSSHTTTSLCVGTAAQGNTAPPTPAPPTPPTPPTPALSAVNGVDEAVESTREDSGDVREIYPERGFVERVIAIHGPDCIRSVFEAHYETALRLDVVFALSLCRILRSANTHLVVPGTRWLHAQYAPWLAGWKFMQTVTEATFGRCWYEMEDEMWSCRSAIKSPLLTPVLRILSRNDPVVPLHEHGVVNPAFFTNLSKVIVMPDGGHCGVFRWCPEIVQEINQWADKHSVWEI